MLMRMEGAVLVKRALSGWPDGFGKLLTAAQRGAERRRNDKEKEGGEGGGGGGGGSPPRIDMHSIAMEEEIDVHSEVDGEIDLYVCTFACSICEPQSHALLSRSTARSAQPALAP